MKYARCQEHQKGTTMTKNTTSTERFTIDFISKKIIGTQASFNKASKGTGEIYEELASKIARHPNFEVAVKEQKKHIAKAKRTYDGMDFKLMEAYIATQKIAEQLMKEYGAVKAMAKASNTSVYPFTKKWFLGKFDPDGKGFNMKKAKEEISAYRLERAILTVPFNGDETVGNEKNETEPAELGKAS